jgi:hypothetical protein
MPTLGGIKLGQKAPHIYQRCRIPRLHEKKKKKEKHSSSQSTGWP